MTVLISIVFLTLLVSASCSLLEATLYSTRMGSLEAAKAQGEKESLAARLIRMKQNIGEPIAAILILNTIAHTAGATFAGVYGVEILGQAWMPLFSVAFTLAILLLTEILPKTLGAVHWRSIWPLIVWPLTAMKYGLYPIIIITEWVSRLLTKGHSAPGVTEEEILAVVRMGEKEGEISSKESEFVHNIIHLENQSVREIMTPRTVIVSVDGNASVEEALDLLQGKGFTRIPVYIDDREDIIGYVVMSDLYDMRHSQRGTIRVRTLAKPITFIPESKDLLAALTRFLGHRTHLAVVVDEYGGVSGLVTLEDIVETILGAEIVDEMDKAVDLQELARLQRKQIVRR